jgi:hypothetical protein
MSAPRWAPSYGTLLVLAAIVAQMPSTQTPNYYCVGAVNSTFEG